MESPDRHYRYVHPYEMCQTYRGMESGNTQMLFTCPCCQGKASFSLPKRVGRCFVCRKILKLQSKYDDIPIDTLFSALPVHVSTTAGGNGSTATRVDLKPRPLSPQAWDYIATRGIAQATVERFGLLAETTYRGHPYLAWPTRDRDYELRAIGPVEEGLEKRTPDGHQKYFSLVQLVPDATTCIVCEGLFSALAYAQLLPRDDAWYVILNSTSNARKLVEALETFTAAGVQTFLLALDNDPAGRATTRTLARTLLDAGVQVECHYPPTPGDDWNDALLRGETIATSPTVVAPVGLVTIESPPVVPAAQPDHLDVHYYEQMLSQYGKVVVATPCGAGKTRAAADLIAQHWYDGILYVAERVDQLHTMQTLLEDRDVPPDVIGLYTARSEDVQALRQTQLTKAIALLTHARMQTHNPRAYMHFAKHGGLAPRRRMIVDESIAPLLILSVPRLFIEGCLRQMHLDWTDLGRLLPQEIDGKIAGMAQEIALHAHYPFQRVGIRYQDWTNDLPSVDSIVEIRHFAYYQMLYQILARRYLRRDEDIDVLVPMAPHLTWYQCFDQILVLDATAPLTDFLYPDYEIKTPGTWNYAQITEAYQVYTDLGDLTKTNISKHRELFLQELQTLTPMLDDFEHPYIVTYKQLAADVQTVLRRPVQYYGATRGSNAYRTTAAAVLLGAYRPPVSFDQLAQLLFGTKYHPVNMAVAHWMQETYRTRIRSGEPITLLAIGEHQAIHLFEQTIGRPLSTVTIAGPDDPERLERILSRLHSQTQRELLRQLRRDAVVDIRTFARDHTGRDPEKVIRAVRGLLQRHPQLEGHIVRDETTVRLIAKPVPRR